MAERIEGATCHGLSGNSRILLFKGLRESAREDQKAQEDVEKHFQKCQEKLNALMAEGYKAACESLDFSQQAAFNAMTLLHGLREETEVLHPSMNTSLCETLDKFLHQCDPVEKLDIG